MKRHCGSVIGGALVIVFGLFAQSGAALTNQEIVRGNSAFAWELYAHLRQTEGNLFFSPYSVSLALAMTYAGARGDTAEQMANALHFPGRQAEFHPALADLARQVREASESDGVELRIANSLWPDTSLRLFEPFLETLRQHYEAALFPVDFVGETAQSRQEINAWVAERTEEKIPELLQSDDLTAQTVLVLVNAIWFKGDWAAPFEPEQTQEAPFATPDGPVTVPMMRRQGTFEYAADDRVQTLALPYAGERLHMLILLPQDPHDFEWLEAALTPEFVLERISELEPQKAQIAVPKFTLRERFALLDTLEAMGWHDLTDFSGMAAPSPFLSNVIHEAYVEVNEQGTEAAAATAVVMGRSLPRYVEFTADHPFVFCLIDASSASLLFIGRVLNPNE